MPLRWGDAGQRQDRGTVGGATLVHRKQRRVDGHPACGGVMARMIIGADPQASITTQVI